MAVRGAVGLLTLAGTITAALGGCSSGGRRDQNYGSNEVGVTYKPPEPPPPSEAGAERAAAGDRGPADAADARPDAGADGARD